jgi:hypothetical protein
MKSRLLFVFWYAVAALLVIVCIPTAPIWSLWWIFTGDNFCTLLTKVARKIINIQREWAGLEPYTS